MLNLLVITLFGKHHLLLMANAPIGRKTLEVLSFEAHTLHIRLNTFASGSLASHRAVCEVSDGAIREAEAGHHVVLPDRILFPGWKRVRGNTQGLGIEQPVHQVYKVACLPKNRATNRGISHPIAAGDPGRIDSALQHGGSASLRQSLFHLQVIRRKTTVEADGEMTTTGLDGARQVVALLFRQSHWLLHKHVFPGLKSLQGLGCMVLISTGDED